MLTHWSYVLLALTHRYHFIALTAICFAFQTSKWTSTSAVMPCTMRWMPHTMLWLQQWYQMSQILQLMPMTPSTVCQKTASYFCCWPSGQCGWAVTYSTSQKRKAMFWDRSSYGICNYRQVSNIRHTKSPNLNVSRVFLQMSLSNPLTPEVLSRDWRCSWSSADRRCSSYIWVINHFIAL